MTYNTSMYAELFFEKCSIWILTFYDTKKSTASGNDLFEMTILKPLI